MPKKTIIMLTDNSDYSLILKHDMSKHAESISELRN